MKAILPFGIIYTPMEKLALVNFNKHPDPIYKGLELQYLKGEETGAGYRVLAYRNDGYVDMYDDPALKYNPNEKCDVAEKGLNKHIQTQISDAVLEKGAEGVQISFGFEDLENRVIQVVIKEKTEKRSIPLNILAPIGVGSVRPTALPMFFLYNFDFVRKKDTIVDFHIDGVPIKLDPFPAPLPLTRQMRYYTRYSLESQIIDFLPTDLPVKEVELDEQLKYFEQGISYAFVQTEKGVGLSQMELLGSKKMVINFNPAFLLEDQTGTFSISPSQEMGHIDGSYQVERNGDKVSVSLVPSQGWTSVPNTLMSKILLSPQSMFCSWCKNYHYSATIDLRKMTASAQWKNGN